MSKLEKDVWKLSFIMIFLNAVIMTNVIVFENFGLNIFTISGITLSSIFIVWRMPRIEIVN